MKTILLLFALAFQDGFVIKGGDTPKPKPDGSGFVVKPRAQEPAKAKVAVEWLSYAAAYAKHKDGVPMVVLATMPGCLPCQTVKKEIEAAAIQGVAYCYLDVTVETDLAGKLAIGPTVPVLMVFAKFSEASSRYGGEQLHAGVATKAIQDATKPAPAKSSSAKYSYRVERITEPRGYGPAYVEGDSYYNHVTRDHGHQIRGVLERVSIVGMSDRDLFALHSLLHSGLSTGYWDGACYVFQLP
jgi:hypothetical protein